MDTTSARETLKELIRKSGDSYASISKMLGRNSAYVQQFITRGSPSRLDEADRRALASYFGVDEQRLGGSPGAASSSSSMVQVPRLSVQASAGVGSIVDGEFAIGAYGFDAAWLRNVCRAKPHDLSIIQVTGDSMAPTLIDGDDVLVDRSDAGSRLRDGIYVLRRDETLMVKRLALAPMSSTLTISSDNPAYPTWSDCPLSSVQILGRVVWTGRKLG